MARCLKSRDLGAPPDTYFYALANSSQAGSTFATIGSDDALRLFDGKLKLQHSVATGHNGVACLAAGNDNSNASFVTGGSDGHLRCWDARTGQAIAQVMADPRGAAGVAAVTCQGPYIAAGTESLKEGLGDVSVLLYDTRQLAGGPVRQYIESHTDTVTQLAFHPTLRNVLLSGSTDGLVSVFDVDWADEDDALQQVVNPRAAVHCAGFLAPDQVYVVSMDEQYSVYTLAKTVEEDEQVPPPRQFGDVREALGCQYVVNVLLQAAGPPLMVHGHTGKRDLSIVSLGSPGAWAFGQTIKLPGAHDEELVRDVILVDQRAYSCGEDGRVKVWSLGT